MSKTHTHKVLVANRSEIACRIFQTCREMGLKTVAICAPGDEEARHVTYADEVVAIKSYLDIDSVIGAAKSTGATLIHPGYGFLSERPAFAAAVEKAGIIFVGPRAETMEAMGDKIAAKKVAIAAGVPTLPWAQVQPGEDLKAVAKKVGFPKPEELEAAAESATAEAIAAFGDGTLFLERWVDQPRHIEVQVFGDGMGNGIHLHERECSLQRRHQKVWEEATAPHLLEETRKGLFEAALSLVKSVKYRSAGTLEFLVDAKGEFFFLEMNTRLQVEHPVTELVTGVDLVWAQITQALAPKETILRETPVARGHAIEVRIYAEDPAQGFMPTPGKVEKIHWPTGPGIRVDSGIEEGQTIGTSFDSMLAKLIVFAPTRDHALARMKFALEETVIFGVGTNQDYLRAMASHPAVREGRVHTGFLGTEFKDYAPKLQGESLAVLSAAYESVKTSGPPFGSDLRQTTAQFPSPWHRQDQGGSQ